MASRPLLDLGVLPRRTRLLLAFTRYVDNLAYWLICHDHCTAARRLWKICGMWH